MQHHEKKDHEKKDQEKKDHEKYEPKADHVTCRNTEKDHYDTKAVCDVALAALELAKQTECNAYVDMKAQPLSLAVYDPNNGDTYEVWAQRICDQKQSELEGAICTHESSASTGCASY